MEVRKISDNWVVIFVAVAALLTVSTALAQKPGGKDIWSDKPDARSTKSKRWELSEKRIEQILQRLEQEKPEEAKRLKRLRQEDPEKFKEAIRNRARKDFLSTSGHEEWRQRMEKWHQEYIEWLRKEYPDEAQRLIDLQAGDPDRYPGRLRASRRKYGPIMEAGQKNPELAEVLKEDLGLQQWRKDLIEQISTAEGPKRKELTEQLRAVISKRFDLIVRKKQLRYEELVRKIEQLRKRVQQQQAEVEKLKEKKQRTIKQRMEELIGKTEKINWE